MATALKSKSFQRNLLISIGGVFLLFAVCFSVYQYQREKEYKIDILHSRLQMYNYEMVQTLGEDSLTNNRLFCDYVERHNMEKSSRLCMMETATISSVCRNPPTRRISIQPLGLATPLYVPLYHIRQS